MFKVEVVLDSLNPFGDRITTIKATYPRFIHSELMTHRDRARNAASSRAISFDRMTGAVLDNPVAPIDWPSEKKGMQGGDSITLKEKAQDIWLHARLYAVKYAQQLHDLGVHKSICNRLLEPWAWITVIMTATKWKNFFKLRDHPDAEIHFQHLTKEIKRQMSLSNPPMLCVGQWHLPLVDNVQADLDTLKKISVARCARISYNREIDFSIEEDVKLHNRLLESGHWSPFEHQAQAMDWSTPCGPFIGWRQYRKFFKEECAD